MKKILLTSAFSLMVAGAAFGQGSVNWGSIPFTAVTAQTNSTVASTFAPGVIVGPQGQGLTAGAQTGTAFYYALLFTSFSGTQAAQPTTMSQLTGAGWQAAPLLTATNSNTAGRLQVAPANSGAQVSWSPGTTNSIMLVGWSGNLGTSWAAVANVLANWNTLGSGIVGQGFFGTSSTGYINPLLSTSSVGATMFGNGALSAQGLPIFSTLTQLNVLVPTPEPGTLALAALGGASLLMFRRRNSK